MDIHSPQRMIPKDFGNPLTFNLAPPAGSFHLSSEISQHTPDRLAQNSWFPFTSFLSGQKFNLSNTLV